MYNDFYRRVIYFVLSAWTEKPGEIFHFGPRKKIQFYFIFISVIIDQ
jgi:hypothetical protein